MKARMTFCCQARKRCCNSSDRLQPGTVPRADVELASLVVDSSALRGGAMKGTPKKHLLSKSRVLRDSWRAQRRQR